MAETAYNSMLAAANGYKKFAVAVHDELKEDTEQLELSIRIGHNNGLFHPTSDRCPCVRQHTSEFVTFLDGWGIDRVMNSIFTIRKLGDIGDKQLESCICFL